MASGASVPEAGRARQGEVATSARRRSAGDPIGQARGRGSLRRMGDPARDLHPDPSTYIARETAKAVRGFGALGVVAVWLFEAPPSRAFLVITRGDDPTRDAHVRRQLELMQATKVAFLSEEFPVTVAGGVRVVPAPPPDNSPEAVRKRSEQRRAELARMGINPDEPEQLISAEEMAVFEAELLRHHGL
jgi:hypothetical protein